MSWFEQLVGFEEIDPDQVRSNMTMLDNGVLVSKVNGNAYRCGTLEIPRLESLREQIPYKDHSSTEDEAIRIREMVGDVQQLHLQYDKAVFQAASQFNLLEMASPHVVPEQGVAIYECDHTQGPACAIACGAGTVYRNYFVEINNKLGQTTERQIDCLSDLGSFFNNDEKEFWKVRNGYAFFSREGLEYVNRNIRSLSTQEYEALKGRLRIGIQMDTEVTIDPDRKTVTQAYCSALPIGYSNILVSAWEPVARLILEATYEATFYAAVQNQSRTGNNHLFLTLVGGGVFGNPLEWILDAIGKAVRKFCHVPLEVNVVSYGVSNSRVSAFVESLQKEFNEE